MWFISQYPQAIQFNFMVNIASLIKVHNNTKWKFNSNFVQIAATRQDSLIFFLLISGFLLLFCIKFHYTPRVQASPDEIGTIFDNENNIVDRYHCSAKMRRKRNIRRLGGRRFSFQWELGQRRFPFGSYVADWKWIVELQRSRIS